MVKSLLHTLGSRFIIAILNLALLFITTKWMGAENKGEISLLVLNLSFAAIVSGLFGGPSLVYLIPRFPIRNILLLNYLWSFLTSIILSSVLYFEWLPSNIRVDEFFLLSFLECLLATHLMILLGKEKIKLHNYLQLIKITLVVGLLVGVSSTGAQLDYDSFKWSYGVGLGATYFLSILFISRSPSYIVRNTSFYLTARACLKYGSLVQIGNIAQLFNYRLSFYFLELLILPPKLALIRIGIYAATLQVSEALWQFARSVSVVQYARVSNMNDKNESLNLSLVLSRLNLSVTTFGVFILLLIPESFYVTAFGQEFGEIKLHFIILSPGILALSVSNAFSHFFAGIGRHKINTESSVFGFILTVFIGFLAINYMGTVGAALTASFVYIAQTSYQFVKLSRLFNVKLGQLIPTKADIKGMINMLESLVGS